MARKRAESADVADRVDFEVATHVRETLADDGAWMIVEPSAEGRVEDDLTPFGRLAYAMSTVAWTPNSLSVGYGLGAQASEKRTREVVTEGGVERFRRAAATPTGLVFEAKP